MRRRCATAGSRRSPAVVRLRRFARRRNVRPPCARLRLAPQQVGAKLLRLALLARRLAATGFPGDCICHGRIRVVQGGARRVESRQPRCHYAVILASRRSSVVERTLGKGEVECSIHSGGTMTPSPAVNRMAGARLRKQRGSCFPRSRNPTCCPPPFPGFSPTVSGRFWITENSLLPGMCLRARLHPVSATELALDGWVVRSEVERAGSRGVRVQRMAGQAEAGGGGGHQFPQPMIVSRLAQRRVPASGWVENAGTRQCQRGLGRTATTRPSCDPVFSRPGANRQARTSAPESGECERIGVRVVPDRPPRTPVFPPRGPIVVCRI